MIRNIFRKAGEAIRSTISKLKPAFLTDAPAERNISLRERRYDLACLLVKRKLGAAFFTRQLNPKTRKKRVESLRKWERELASEKGWI
jgi:hypothetical protein